MIQQSARKIVFLTLYCIQSSSHSAVSSLPCTLLYPVFLALCCIQSSLHFAISSLAHTLLYPVFLTLCCIQSSSHPAVASLPCTLLYPVFLALFCIQSPLHSAVSSLSRTLLFLFSSGFGYSRVCGKQDKAECEEDWIQRSASKTGYNRVQARRYNRVRGR